MKNAYILLCLLLFLSKKNYAQGENNNWYFGDKAGVNFSTTTPLSLSNSQMTQLESVASISNASGNLLFYTNGVNVWNREHQIMTNGTGLLGNDTTEQVIILPHPGDSNLYYIFTMSNVFASTCNIVYSIIDMSNGAIGLDGNRLGAVSAIKNISLLDETGSQFTVSTEAITTTSNNNNDGYWILIPNKTSLYSYRLNNSGFINTPVVSPSPFPSALSEYSQIKISPNLPTTLNLPFTNLVAITLWNNVTQANSIRINSFDNSTGLLSNLYNAPINNANAYSTDFSSDGLLLYAGIKAIGIFVFDLFNTNTSTNTRQVTNQYLSYGTIQRGINNEIYVSCDSNSFLSRILNPNSFPSSSFILNSINLNNTHLASRFCKLGLPQLVPILPRDICMEHRILSWSETNINSNYQASNFIITNNNYSVNSGQNTTLIAGNTIVLSPNTTISTNSNFWARIESCNSNSNKIVGYTDSRKIENSFDVNEVDNYFKIYPNPVSNGTLFIETSANAEKTVTIFDVLGKQVLNTTTTSNEINVASIKGGIYLVKITEEGKTATRKLVIK